MSDMRPQQQVRFEGFQGQGQGASQYPNQGQYGMPGGSSSGMINQTQFGNNTYTPYNQSGGNQFAGTGSMPNGGFSQIGGTAQSQLDPNTMGKVAGYHSASQKFTGTMHPDSTIFKNLPASNSSLAGQGILRKDPSRMNKESLGLNPNIRVEDEYIDNLMKQIHFMNLEINLLKQKQDENKDVMGIRALMQKDKHLYVDHIIEANTKFMDLLKEKTFDKITLEDRLLRADEKKQKLGFIRDLQKKRHDESGNHYRDLDDKLRLAIKENRDKLQADRDFRGEMQQQLDKLARNAGEAKTKNEELNKYVSEKDLFDKMQKAIDEDEDKILLEQIAIKAQLIDSIAEVKDAKQKLLNDDARLRDLKAANGQLMEELGKKQMESSDTDYRVMEIEARQQLAIKIKEKDALDRKNLYDEYEILKDKLDEEIKKNNDKIEKKLRESSFEELGKRDIVLRKTQEELNVLKVQYDRIHKEFKNFKLDELRKNTYLTKLKKENDK